jgi:hypothetical protein
MSERTPVESQLWIDQLKKAGSSCLILLFGGGQGTRPLNGGGRWKDLEIDLRQRLGDSEKIKIISAIRPNPSPSILLPFPLAWEKQVAEEITNKLRSDPSIQIIMLGHSFGAVTAWKIQLLINSLGNDPSIAQRLWSIFVGPANWPWNKFPIDGINDHCLVLVNPEDLISKGTWSSAFSAVSFALIHLKDYITKHDIEFP